MISKLISPRAISLLEDDADILLFPLGDSLDLHPYEMLLGKTSSTHRSCMTFPLPPLHSSRVRAYILYS